MFRVLLVQSHYGRPAKATYQPWMPENREFLGWKVFVNGDDENTVNFYAVPDLEAEVPTIRVFVGNGDPETDACVGQFTINNFNQ